MYLDSCFRIFKELMSRQLPFHSSQKLEANTQITILSTRFQFLLSWFGGAREDRTPDLLRAKQALSQLSYGPFSINNFQ